MQRENQCSHNIAKANPIKKKLKGLALISNIVLIQMQSISSLTNASAFSTCENRVYSSVLCAL